MHTVLYLKELKQHVVKVRRHIHNAYWLAFLLFCTEEENSECFLISATSFKIN